MKKFITYLLVGSMLLGLCTGCAGGDTSEIDETKSQLNVGIFNAGLGTTWLDEAIEDFEAYYADKSFEENKTGIEVIKDAKKSEFRPGNLLSTMEYYDNAIYFLDQSNYSEYVSQGLLADITDVINEKIYDEDGNFAADTGKAAVKSIFDTISSDTWKQDRSVNGRYYAVPYFMSVSGMIYDADLFNDRGYYYYANGQIGAKQADIDAGTCGTGPDGVLGTLDDGLPYSWNDFVKLMNYMVTDGVIPFTWSGATSYQRLFFYEQVWANYEGANDYLLNYTFSGTESDLGPISDNNATILKNQEGRKAGIKAAYDIIKNSNYYSSNAINGQSHTEAQFEYIDSIETDTPIAMFFEGGYWEAEARTVFDDAAITNPDHGYGQRDFRYMATPNFVGVEGVTDQKVTVGEKEVLVAGGEETIICLSAKNTCENPELQSKLAKLFLQFVHTRKQLAQFTQYTGGCIRANDFKVENEELSAYTKYGQSLYKYIEEGATIVWNVMPSAKIKASLTNYERDWFFGARVGNEAMAGEPMGFFLKYPSYTVDQCYELVKEGVERFFA